MQIFSIKSFYKSLSDLPLSHRGIGGPAGFPLDFVQERSAIRLDQGKNPP
ncbi:MAG: hypothetical protein [Olavius algarvensis Gamma 1 endosymbiont]|nr:MAG: hypothetical protein [Olavius algarvensis Gamma 1 endosymbiont]